MLIAEPCALNAKHGPATYIQPLRRVRVSHFVLRMLFEGAGGNLSGGIHTGMLPEGEFEMYSLSTPRNIHA